MSSITVPVDSLPPFGTQPMQTVVDRLQLTLRNFVTRWNVLRCGVLMTSKRWLSHKSHKMFMQKLYKIADKKGEVSLLRHVSFDRLLKLKNKTTKLVRGGKMWASRDRLCEFIGSQVGLARPPLNITTTAIYWEHYHMQRLSVHPYLDVDIGCNTDNEYKFDDVFSPVYTAIKLMNEAFTVRVSPRQENFQVLICYNHRKLSGGKSKHSFHVHWYQLVCNTMEDLSSVVRQVASKCPLHPDGETKLLDLSPYGHNEQLFRIPYCGKLDDDTCILLPIRPTKTDNGKWSFCVINDRSPSVVINQSCTSTLFPDKYLAVKPDSVPRAPALPVSAGNEVLASTEEDKHNFANWTNFWMPVLKFYVIPHFIKSRQQCAARAGIACTFPDVTDKHVIQDIKRLRAFPASFRVCVDGDTFCEYDSGSTPHVHSYASNSITYVVDLNNGKIAQQCLKCKPATLKWFYFIANESLAFPIMDAKTFRCEGNAFVTVAPHTNVIPFILTFFSETILFARDCKQVMVYDENTGVWKGGSDGNRLLLCKINILNERHANYRRARNMHIRDEMVRQFCANNPNASREEKEKNEASMDKECKKANKQIKPIWNVSLTARKTLIEGLRPDQHPHQVEGMEPHNHLVPLENKQCVNIYTWTTREIHPSDYFVSALSAEIIHLDDPSVSDFVEWQRKVCCGDPEYLQYKLRILGLSLSMFNFDRSFYMPLGPVGRNGKGSESFLFNEVTMKCTPSRGYYMSREYLTKSGQDRKGANAADTVMTDLANKCVVITDECRDVALDGPLIKTLVSGDRQSGRNLYESERINVHNRGKLWIIANKTPKLDYTDPALMDRCRVLPYNARWVPNPAAVIVNMTDITQHMWVFQDDPFFKEKTLKTWGSAMTTKCLYELHLFLKQLPRDPDSPERPARLETIPVPKCVRNATKQTIEREHPVRNFINNYMGQVNSTRIADFVTVETAFVQFQRFGKNENSRKIQNFNRCSFQDALEKEDIGVVQGPGGIAHFKGWIISKEVPNLDKDAAPVNDGYYYVPPPAEKRPRYE